MLKIPLKMKITDNFPQENLSMNPFSKPFFLEKSIIDDIFQLNNQIHIAIPPVISLFFITFPSFFHFKIVF